LLPIPKIHFTHLQQYDDKPLFTLQEQDVTVKKAGGNVTTHAQHRIIKICTIYASS